MQCRASVFVATSPVQVCLLRTSFSSARDFASDFLKIPPRDGHPCLRLTAPTAKPAGTFTPKVHPMLGAQPLTRPSGWALLIVSAFTVPSEPFWHRHRLCGNKSRQLLKLHENDPAGFVQLPGIHGQRTGLRAHGSDGLGGGCPKISDLMPEALGKDIQKDRLLGSIH